jgi:hypothetical protein
MRLRFLILLPLCWAWAPPIWAAPLLLDLFLKAPAPPSDGTAAATWVRDGQIVAGELLSFEARLRQETMAAAKRTDSSSPSTTDRLAVLAAVQSYDAYKAQNSEDQDPALLLGKRSAWISKRFDGVRKRMGSKAVGDHNAVDDELKAWGGLFRDWQTSRRTILEKAQAELAAVDAFHARLDEPQRQSIAAYRSAMIREIEIELSITRLALERFATRP